MWGQYAQVRVDGDFLYRLGFGAFRVGVAGRCGLGLGKVEAGDLEAIKEQACAARVDVVGGDALEDLADGVLDRGLVFREWEIKGGATGSAGSLVFDWFAVGVVVVAERFSAEAWAAAAATVGEDVAALVTFGCFEFGVEFVIDGVVHGIPPRVLFCAKSSKD